MKKVRILGTGCLKCQELFDNTQEAMKNLGIEDELTRISNVNDIIAYGVMVTPALVIDEMVWSSGDVPSVEAIEEMFRKQDSIR
ncbi:MAG: TM0996/MTH895 family glutaredoxin-like protein [Candidatus Aegiribacteria sp.]|nr:TM0996/MTH895 family glutaredoxin-like protein [Candidatus Aegiribacteria sp.]